MGIRYLGKTVRAIALSATMLGTFVVGIGEVAAAGSGPTTRLQSADSCTSRVTETGFAVTWQSTLEADRFIVERFSFNRYWWRGRVDSQAATFNDGLAPAGAASMNYRIVAKTAQGDTVGILPCPLQPTEGFVCVATELFDGKYRIQWSGQEPGSTSDVVIRRSVAPGGPAYWRAILSGSRFIDTPSSTGRADYVVYARTTNRITAYTTCSNGAVDEPCSAATTDLPAIECAALQSLNDRGLGEEPTTDPCDWLAITCANAHVTRINRDGGLQGPIPPGLGDLAHLEYLRLVNTQLSGSIPPELTKLSNLEHLQILSNDISGPIPPGITSMTNLRHLSLIGRDLAGPLPQGLRNLTGLEVLRIWGSGLSGPIPKEIGDLINLRQVDLRGDQLSGTIPSELGQLVDLELLHISGGDMEGQIPIELSNLSNLQSLSFVSSNLSGPIPSELSELTKLTELSLVFNKLTGPIPAELGNLSNLTRLRLDGNQLSGQIPPELANLTNLVQLTAYSNDLTGSIPPGLGDLRKLTLFMFAYNALTGPIPAELGNLTEVSEFHLNGNQLSGQIPAELGNLTKITSLLLQNNQLTGTIPAELSNMNQIVRLYLNHNQLTGDVTPAFAGLMDTLLLVTIPDGAGGNNCITATDPVVAAWLDTKAPGWEECE